MNKHRQTENLLLYLIWAILLVTTSLSWKIPLAITFYFGLGGLIFTTLIFLFKPNLKTWAMITYSILATFGILSFDPITSMHFGFSIGSILVQIEIVPLTILIVLLLKRKKWLSKELDTLKANQDSNRQEKLQQRTSEYRDKFEKLTTDQIELKLQNDLQPEAQKVLTEILEERKTRYNNK